MSTIHARIMSLAWLALAGPALADAVVIGLKGTATASLGDAPLRELRKGDSVKAGETVATVGASASVTLRLDDGSIMTLRGNSKMKVKSPCVPGDPACPGKSVTDLRKGEGRFQPRAQAPQPRPGMPTGLAAIRGETCAPDAARFRDVGPTYFVDETTRLVWARCAHGQGFDSASGSCKGSITATESLAVAKEIAAAFSREAGTAWRLPTIEELSALAAATCGKRFFGRTPLSDYGGAPVWTDSSAGEGKVYQFDPAKGGRTAEAEDNAPGVILLVTAGS